MIVNITFVANVTIAAGGTITNVPASCYPSESRVYGDFGKPGTANGNQLLNILNDGRLYIPNRALDAGWYAGVFVYTTN